MDLTKHTVCAIVDEKEDGMNIKQTFELATKSGVFVTVAFPPGSTPQVSVALPGVLMASCNFGLEEFGEVCEVCNTALQIALTGKIPDEKPNT